MKTNYLLLMLCLFIFCACDKENYDPKETNNGINDRTISINSGIEDATLTFSKNGVISTRSGIQDATLTFREMATPGTIEIIWSLSGGNQFKSLTLETPGSNNPLPVDPTQNSYIIRLTTPGYYTIWLNFEYWENGHHFTSSKNTSYTHTGGGGEGTICKHDYSNLKNSANLEITDSRAIFTNLVSLEDFRFILTSPYINDFKLESYIYASPAVQTLEFSLPQKTLYNLKIYSRKCNFEPYQCTDYLTLNFSNSVPHYGPEPILFY